MKLYALVLTFFVTLSLSATELKIENAKWVWIQKENNGHIEEFSYLSFNINGLFDSENGKVEIVLPKPIGQGEYSITVGPADKIIFSIDAHNTDVLHAFPTIYLVLKSHNKTKMLALEKSNIHFIKRSFTVFESPYPKAVLLSLFALRQQFFTLRNLEARQSIFLAMLEIVLTSPSRRDLALMTALKMNQQQIKDRMLLELIPDDLTNCCSIGAMITSPNIERSILPSLIQLRPDYYRNDDGEPLPRTGLPVDLVHETGQMIEVQLVGESEPSNEGKFQQYLVF